MWNVLINVWVEMNLLICSVLFCQGYLQARVCSLRPRVLGPFLQALVVSWSLVCSLSRITDHRHHWWDVLAGSILGAIMAYYSVSKPYMYIMLFLSLFPSLLFSSSSPLSSYPSVILSSLSTPMFLRIFCKINDIFSQFQVTVLCKQFVCDNPQLSRSVTSNGDSGRSLDNHTSVRRLISTSSIKQEDLDNDVIMPVTA